MTQGMNQFGSWSEVVCGAMACIFLALLGGTIIWKIWNGEIDISMLISEENGDASMSRFQLLIFTFVIAISLFKIIETKVDFPVVPNSILTLLGISASTYAVGKSIHYAGKDADKDDGTRGGGTKISRTSQSIEFKEEKKSPDKDKQD